MEWGGGGGGKVRDLLSRHHFSTIFEVVIQDDGKIFCKENTWCSLSSCSAGANVTNCLHFYP